MTDKTPIEAELSELMIEALNLDLTADEIDPVAPLYGEGLGLDSIDMLEVSLAVSKKYGVQLKADDQDNQKIFASLRALSRHIEQHRPR